MVQLDILQNAIKNFKPSLEDLPQQNFDQIVDLVEKEDLNKAAEIIQKIFNQGNFDVRLIAYYLYAHLLNHGVRSLNEILPLFTLLMKDYWEILRPFHKKEKQIENSLNWFFTSTLDQIKYGERLAKEGKAHPFWEKSIAQLTDTELLEILQTSSQFKDFFYAQWPQSSIQERVAHLIKKIEDLRPFIPLDKELKNASNDLLSNEPLECSQTASSSVSDKHEKAQESVSDLFQSVEMLNLIKKLKTFELLIKKKEFLKASLLSKNIAQNLEHFDPCIYFPKLFSSYFALLARYTSVLAEPTEQELLQWKYLEKLCRTDLDQFLDW
jgi:hypothetical protein